MGHAEFANKAQAPQRQGAREAGVLIAPDASHVGTAMGKRYGPARGIARFERCCHCHRLAINSMPWPCWLEHAFG
jgi:hypothetical protein